MAREQSLRRQKDISRLMRDQKSFQKGKLKAYKKLRSKDQK